jgi:hypothetical protein
MSVRLTTRIRMAARLRAFSRQLIACALTASAALLLLASTPGPAWAVSTRDLVELSKAGLGDDVLVALIEADGTVFNLDAPRILQLRAEGVSERVITAMIRNAPHPPSAPVPAAAASPAEGPPAPATPVLAEQSGAPYFVVIGEKPAAPPPAPEPTYYVPWIPAWGVRAVRPARPAQPTMGYRGFGRFINDGWVDSTRH